MGVRISSHDPPRIEFPTVHRIKGKGNTYRSTGKWISWQDLKQKNPVALIDPPSLDDFVKRGGQVGAGQRLEPGAYLKEERRFKVVKRKKSPVESNVSAPDDMWVGGSSQSIYATNESPSKTHKELQSKNSVSGSRKGNEEVEQDGWLGGESATTSRLQVAIEKKKNSIGDAMHTLEKDASVAPTLRPLRKSRSGLSLSERLGMDSLKEASKAEPMPNTESENLGDDTIACRKTSKREKPPKLDLLDQVCTPAINSLQFSEAQTPLSATHSPPETPLKYMWRGENKRNDLPITPSNELAIQNATLIPGSARLGGLLLDPGEGVPVLPKELQTPKRETIALNMTSNTADTSASTKQSQVDQMLAKVRLARSSAGTQESRWAIKETDSANIAEETSSKGEKPQIEPPKAPRALREAQSIEEQAPTQPNASKSLLERMGSIAIGDKAAEKPTKKKKEKKKGTKKEIIRHEDEDPPSVQSKNGTVKSEATNSAHPIPVDSSSTKDAPVSSSDSPISDIVPPPPPPSSLLAPSVSASSNVTEATTEGSNFGNDTLTSINWADSDDDELPDLPEEWTRASQTAIDGSEFSNPSSKDDEVLPAQGTTDKLYPSASATSQRGAKRGLGRGRGKKEREDGQDELPRGPRGLRIAGSAIQGSREVPKTAPKELFPSHKLDASIPNGPRVERNRPQPRDQKPHGRPKLVTNNADAFSRLTKGALGTPSSGQGVSRSQKQAKGGATN